MKKEFKDYLEFFLTQEERNPSWLSRKLNCSHTLVHNWLQGVSYPNELHRSKLKTLFGNEYDFGI